VEVLRTLNLLDTGSEEPFDRITEACSKILHVPVALVSLVDTDRQWFKSRCGLAASETSRDVAFCAHVINQTEPGVFMVPDATKDERFKYSSLVNGPPHIRFYAGAALEYTDEHGDQWKLGTLCVIDMKPREFSAEEQVMLMTLSRLVVAEIQLRKKMVKEQEEELHRRAKEHSQELEVAREGAHDVAKDLKAQYIGQVAHDLRTPLNSFSLGLQALATTPLSQEQQDIVATMQVSSELMHLTCQKALDHTRTLHSIRHKAARKPFNILDMLEKSLLVVAGYTHESKDVEYEYVIADNVSPFVISDEDFVWQMLMNLLCNARKFTTAGYVRTEVSVVTGETNGGQAELHNAPDGSASSGADGPFLKVAVLDTGIGVREEDRHLLFKPFGQLQEFCGGTGLGLSSTREKATSLGGSCGVKANHPKGSEFWFTIPYVPAAVPKGDGSFASIHRAPMRKGSDGSAAVASPDQTAHVIAGPEAVAEGEEEDEDWMMLAERRRVRRMDSSSIGTDSFRRARRGQGLGGSSASGGSARSIGSARSRSGACGTHNSHNSSVVSLATTVHYLSMESVGEAVGDAPVAAAPVHDAQPKEVLVIEDDVPTRALMAHGLKKQGFVVHQAGNGYDGLGMMKERRFDLVLSDIMMPVMDGLECAKRLREWEATREGEEGASRQFICALSANSEPEDVEKV